MHLQETKSVLAKLMASENITVAHDGNASTAYFDLKNRKLVCPVWKDMDGDLYDLLMGHEVSHALETPLEGWHDAICERGDGFKSILNVVEDSRIERLIKTKYPGLRKSFVNAYRTLAERDFFGIDGMNISDLNFADRINLYEKIGAFTFVPFSDAEKEILQQVQTTKTWEDVVRVAELVYAEVDRSLNDMQQNQQPNQEDEDSESNQSQSGGSQDSEQSESEQSESEKENGQSDSDSAEGNDSRQDSQENESDQDCEDSKDQVMGSKGNGSRQEPKSITDQNFRSRELELIDEGSNSPVYYHYPVFKKEIIEDFSTILDEFQEYSQAMFKDNIIRNAALSYQEYCQDLEIKFKNENKKYIDLLVKEFEMRKNAAQYSRSHDTKTGELNTKKLANYKFTNDLFRRLTETPKGKSHGLVMFIDFSRSMRGVNLKNAIEQMLCLVSFCKKVNIPFSVYSFTSKRSDDVIYQWEHDESALGVDEYSSVNICKLISSDLKVNEYKRVFNSLLVCSDLQNKIYHYNFFNMGNTPFIEMLYVARVLVPEFKKEKNLDVMNLIILSDGVGTSNCPQFYNAIPIFKKMYLVDQDTGAKFRVRSVELQVELSQSILGNMDANVIGFFIGSRLKTLTEFAVRETQASLIRKKDTKYSENVRSMIKKEMGENGFVCVPSPGFDEYYIVCRSNYSEVKKSTFKNEKKKLLEDFKSSQANKLNSKLIASRFCKKISAQAWAG